MSISKSTSECTENDKFVTGLFLNENSTISLINNTFTSTIYI